MNPWSENELKEIARLRKAGHDDSYIRGQMKIVRRSNRVPILLERSEVNMAKKKTAKKASKKKTAKKKAAKKKATRKPGAKPGRKKGEFAVGDKVTAVKGLDDDFYKGFPRFEAYKLICRRKSMTTAGFVDAIEKLDGVKTRAQALGILTKLIEKGAVKTSGAKKAA